MINRKYNKGEIMHNATVVYTDNIQESFEALRVIDKGVISYISKNSIKEIRKGKKRES